MFVAASPKDLGSSNLQDRIPIGIKIQLALDNLGEIELPREDYRVELPLGQIRDGRRVTRTRLKEVPPGQWHRLEIECNAHKDVVVKLNGEVVNALAKAEGVNGRIVLNPKDSEVQFRNPTITINGREEKLEFNVNARK
jgi:hypothetical protein